MSSVNKENQNAPAKEGDKKKDASVLPKKEEELSLEDQQLKEKLELLVERLSDKDQA